MSTLQEAPVIPDFGAEETDRKLAIICSKGNLDMAYPGLILANAALGEGVETHLFFTFWGFDMIVKSRMHDLQFSPVGNTAMHLPGREVHMPQSLTPMPGMTAMATRMLKKQIADIGVPEVPDFLDQVVAAGGHLWACRMSADMMKLDEADLRLQVDRCENGRTTCLRRWNASLSSSPTGRRRRSRPTSRSCTWSATWCSR